MRREQPRPGTDQWAGVVLLAGLVLLLVLLYGVIELGAWVGTGQWVPGHPVLVLVDLVAGRRPWTGGTTAAATAVVLLVVLVLVLVVALVRRRNRNREHVDRKARHMGRPDALSQDVAVRKASEGRLAGTDIAAGLMYGQAVVNGAELWAGWREGMLVEAGPGWGKTRGLGIPLIVEAPGVVVATTNKRDLPDGVRGVCEARGTFWCFDPQRIANYHAGGRPSWWWNPLAQVTGPVEADALAQIFADATAPADAQKHAYFDSAGPGLLANLMLAAASSGALLPQVFEWLNDQRNTDPADILEDAGHRLPASALRGAYNAAPDERSGLFGTAAKAVKFLTSPAILEWVTDDGSRPQFDPTEFVRSGRDTLVSLSREGVGSAGPLTTALTVAVTGAAEREAQRHPHGRLPVPMLAMLDEVANVCRWRELPSQFSFYGSHGIFLVAILQNWAQGETAWKRAGIQQLWDAATVRVVGGGLADDAHLGRVARIVGERHVARRSASSGRSPASTLTYEREQILSVDELAALPPGRFVVIPAGGYPVLGRTVPWNERPAMAEQVQESIARYEPDGSTSRSGQPLSAADQPPTAMDAIDAAGEPS